MQLLTIENGELRLNSNLDEYTFGKTGHDSILNQEGVLFDGKNFRQWTFEEVKSYDAEKNGKTERLVFYCTKNPLGKGAKSLSTFYEEGGKTCLDAVKAVCSAITTAAINNNQLPKVGAGGILVDGDKVLFAPEELFTYAANTLSREETLNQHTGFINETINDLPSLCFERAVIAYRLLSGRLPFTATDSIARNADILDQHFLPIEYCVNGINSKLSLAINKALKLNSTVVNIPGKRKKGQTSEELKPQKEFPLEMLEEAFILSEKQTQNGSDKVFEEKAAAYLKAHNSKINTKRTLRRNATTIVVIAGITLVVIGAIINSVKSRGEDYTSIGLTSSQTICAYLNAVNEKDTSILSSFASGKSINNFSDMVSRIFVIHKQRQAYGIANGISTPAGWLFYATNESKYTNAAVYGITNLKIDEKAASLNVALKKKNEKPAPLEKEGSISLENGSTSVHKISYYLLFPEGETVDFIVNKETATVTLLYKKNRWIITDIVIDSTDLNVDCSAFKTDYFTALNSSEGLVIPAVDSLREKYMWLPEKDAMQREQDRINYELEHPLNAFGL